MNAVKIELGFPCAGNLMLQLDGKNVARLTTEEAKKLHANLDLAIRYLEAQSAMEILKIEIQHRNGFNI